MSRWQINGNSILLDIKNDKNLPHEDHIEMSGLRTSLIIRYGVGINGELILKRHPVWPSLRMIPNNTHASFQMDIEENILPYFESDGMILQELPEQISLDGVLCIQSRSNIGISVKREIFPCVEAKAFMEKITLINSSPSTVKIQIKNNGKASYARGCNGVYIVESRLSPADELLLAAGAEQVLSLTVSARIANEPSKSFDVNAELLRRKARVSEITSPMILETGVPEIDKAFHFAKIRAGESIFQTRGGLIHSPGGKAFYAASWCNDQVEYAGPYFAFTGDAIALEASMNAYRHYMPFMGPEYKAIPSSVIAEGFDIWDGRGDRGDAAMYAYGASRFALASGKRDFAIELWTAIEWCLEYCRRKLNDHGVVASDTDELEERLPSGDANLCSSSLYYGGLISASYLARELGLENKRLEYLKQAEKLALDIDSFFGRNMRGFETYRYYDGNDILRSWICIPICMGLMKRSEGTLAAMFSPYLWTENGMLSQEGDKTFWDRSTLYGLRGAFLAGDSNRAFQKLYEYSARRLLGEHVPYPVEAYPEGDQRHLSAESALYCRVITEGLLGIEPVGLNSFKISPHLPENCSKVSLKNIRAFGIEFDLLVENGNICVRRNGELLKSLTGEGIISF